MPFGYKVNQDGYYEIDEKTAPIVREIFRMYNARMGYTAILRYLHDQGVKSPQGNDFKKNSLNYILRNEKYTGTYIPQPPCPAERQRQTLQQSQPHREPDTHSRRHARDHRPGDLGKNLRHP